MMTLGEYLKKARLEHRLSLRQAEELSGVSNAYISLIENGIRKDPHPNILKSLAKAYNLDIREMMRVAGYLEEKPSERDEKAEIERLYRAAISDPAFSYGRRSKGNIDDQTKKLIATMYRKLKERR
ncbi:MAG: helix-turn-helix transcriptional regulator [candidate division Zixibacteria bacterium]|nr:helix-turn-helix transcriptional regulator [candidate division Zixibacteria bacterium]